MKYILTRHAEDVLAERAIALDWMERVLNTPATVEQDTDDSTVRHHLGKIAEFGDRVLRVVIRMKPEPVEIITVYFDRTMRSKL